MATPPFVDAGGETILAGGGRIDVTPAQVCGAVAETRSTSFAERKISPYTTQSAHCRYH